MSKAEIYVEIKRRSAYTLPEIGMLLFLHRDSETSTIFGIDNSPILLDHIGTEDIFHTIFLQTCTHNNTPFLHTASHCCPMAGLLHLTRVQLKTQGYRPLGLSFSEEEEDSGDGQSPKGGYYNPTRLRCKYTT